MGYQIRGQCIPVSASASECPAHGACHAGSMHVVRWTAWFAGVACASQGVRLLDGAHLTLSCITSWRPGAAEAGRAAGCGLGASAHTPPPPACPPPQCRGTPNPFKRSCDVCDPPRVCKKCAFGHGIDPHDSTLCRPVGVDEQAEGLHVSGPRCHLRCRTLAAPQLTVRACMCASTCPRAVHRQPRARQAVPRGHPLRQLRRRLPALHRLRAARRSRDHPAAEYVCVTGGCGACLTFFQPTLVVARGHTASVQLCLPVVPGWLLQLDSRGQGQQSGGAQATRPILSAHPRPLPIHAASRASARRARWAAAPTPAAATGRATA